jgi:ribosomal protein L9
MKSEARMNAKLACLRVYAARRIAAPVFVVLSCFGSALADELQPPESVELEPITVEGERIREQQQLDPAKALREALERTPQSTIARETRDTQGNAHAKIQTSFSTYCLEARNGRLERKDLGDTFAVVMNCGRQ